MSKHGTAEQPKPEEKTPVKFVLDAVVDDLCDRAMAGKKKYGVFLSHNNGRDHLVDAYQEALDLCMYLKAELMKRDGG